MSRREALAAAIEKGIAAYVRNTRAHVSQSDLFTDIIVEVNRVLDAVEREPDAAEVRARTSDPDPSH